MLVVVGGHSRNIGKTSVVCSIIRALPGWNWTAVKITQFGHGVCSKNGEPCPCDDPTHPVATTREEEVSGTDSGRFLGAGARHAYWVRTQAGSLQDAMPRLRSIIAEADNVVIESNSVLRFLKPDFCAMVVDGSVEDFKPSSLRFLDRADALVLTSHAGLAWPEVPPSLVRAKARFSAPAPRYESLAFIDTLKSVARSADVSRR